MFDDTASIALDFHHSMLSDGNRTNAFLNAILRTVSAGDVVVDIGCGTGVLSLFACLAGARKVFAIEQGPVLDVAREIAEANGYADRIEFLAGWSTEVESRPSNPAITPSSSAASAALRVIAPAWSRLEAKAIMP